MSFIKTAFIIALINFFGVVSIVAIAPLIKNERETESVEDSIPVAPDNKVISPTVTSTTTPTLTTTVSKKTVPSPTTASTPTPNPTLTTDPLAGKCLIYINGTRFNVSEFKVIHGGGDIFQCGTDMTEVFKGQHPDSYLSQMEKYRI